jgi:hypothetical protein
MSKKRAIEHEVVDLTSDDPPASASEVPLTQSTQGEGGEDQPADDMQDLFRLKANVVGKQYYTGMLNNHELVYLIREPHNAYGE